MKIYLASSWKNERLVKAIAILLRESNQEVYCFAEDGYGQHIFNWQDIPNYEKLDGITCLETNDSVKAFNSDKWSLDWANCCLIINPCGRDAHLEAGYIKGKGGKLIILGDFPTGEFSNMYHLADKLIKFNHINELGSYLIGLDKAEIIINNKGSLD